MRREGGAGGIHVELRWEEIQGSIILSAPHLFGPLSAALKCCLVGLGLGA